MFKNTVSKLRKIIGSMLFGVFVGLVLASVAIEFIVQFDFVEEGFHDITFIGIFFFLGFVAAVGMELTMWKEVGADDKYWGWSLGFWGWLISLGGVIFVYLSYVAFQGHSLPFFYIYALFGTLYLVIGIKLVKLGNKQANQGEKHPWGWYLVAVILFFALLYLVGQHINVFSG
jgi:hypothetical protein